MLLSDCTRCIQLQSQFCSKKIQQALVRPYMDDRRYLHVLQIVDAIRKRRSVTFVSVITAVSERLCCVQYQVEKKRNR